MQWNYEKYGWKQHKLCQPQQISNELRCQSVAKYIKAKILTANIQAVRISLCAPDRTGNSQETKGIAAAKHLVGILRLFGRKSVTKICCLLVPMPGAHTYWVLWHWATSRDSNLWLRFPAHNIVRFHHSVACSTAADCATTAKVLRSLHFCIMPSPSIQLSTWKIIPHSTLNNLYDENHTTLKIFGANLVSEFWVKQRAGRRGLGVREAEWERVERP